MKVLKSQEGREPTVASPDLLQDGSRGEFQGENGDGARSSVSCDGGGGGLHGGGSRVAHNYTQCPSDGRWPSCTICGCAFNASPRPHAAACRAPLEY
eukprot:1897146-Rhodomonas_salina.1